MIDIINGCYRCKREYEVNEFLKGLKPAHVHYCNDCVKQCKKCSRWLVITHFLPVLNHPAYKEWLASKSNELDSPLGLLLGRDLVDALCVSCKPFYEPVAPDRVHASPLVIPEPEPWAMEIGEAESELDRLERLINERLQSKQ